MQTVIENVTAASHVIQQAVAPVFLLTGIGAILSVLTGRLGRVVDRFRVLNEKYDAAKQVLAEQPEYAKAIHELYILPVSYTHLDVYKRQPNNRAAFSFVFAGLGSNGESWRFFNGLYLSLIHI